MTGRPAHPGRTTVLIALLLGLVLALGYAVVATLDGRTSGPDPDPAPTFPSFPRFPTPTPPPGTPERGPDHPVRRLGSLAGGSVVRSGSGNAELRYARLAGNGTRLHLRCRGCDADTWLVELPRGMPVGAYGPLEDPSYATAVLDVADPRSESAVLLKAAPGSDWTVTLTPFDGLPVHEETFDALDDDVVAVRARADVRLVCGGPASYRSLAREAGETEYLNVQLGSTDEAGTVVLHPGAGTDLLVLDVSCAGRWTVVPG